MSALDHLWLHFTEMGRYRSGDGASGDRPRRRLLPGGQPAGATDALAGLFCVNIGYGFGRRWVRQRRRRCASCRSPSTGRSPTPRSIELAVEVAVLAPGDLNRVFFVSGGSEAVEAAWKLARQYHTARGERAGRSRAGSPTTAPPWAPSINGCTELRTPFEPLVPDVLHVSNTNRFHRPPGGDGAGVHALPARGAGGDHRDGRTRARSQW